MAMAYDHKREYLKGVCDEEKSKNHYNRWILPYKAYMDCPVQKKSRAG